MENNLRPFCHRLPQRTIVDIFEITDFSQIPTSAGAYIFVSLKEKFIYPNGNSRVIYIGQAVNLRNRIKNHLRNANEVRSLSKNERTSYVYFSRYQYLSKFGGKLYIFTCKGKQESKNLENKLS